MEKKKKPFKKPELREEASLAEVTLQSCLCVEVDDDQCVQWNPPNCGIGGGT